MQRMGASSLAVSDAEPATWGSGARADPRRLLVLSSELPPGGYGSATALGEFLAAVVRHTCWRVDVISPATERKDPAPVWGRARLHETSGCERRGGDWHGNLRLCRFPISAVRRVATEDLTATIVLSWQALPAGAGGSVLARALRAPHVVRLHGPELLERPRARGVAMRTILRRVLANADAVVAKSKQEIDAVRTTGFRGGVHLIPNIAAVPTRSSRADTGGAGCRLLVAARLVPHKRVDVAIEMMRMLETRSAGGFSLTIAGDGPLRTALRRVASATCLPITFLGRVPRDRMADLYADHDLMVHPSAYESSCNAALEARACGLPVLGLASALGDVIRDGEDGVLLSTLSAPLLAEVVTSGRWQEARRDSGPSAVRQQQRTSRDLAAEYDSLFTTLAPGWGK
jgi:glycosyltransferase involved in cell wall biosynthesis